MDKRRRLFFIVAFSILALAGVAMILVAIIVDNEPSWMLPVALLCTVLGNVLNLIRTYIERKD